MRSRRVEAVLAAVCLLSFGSEIAARLSFRRVAGSALSCESASWLVGDCVAYRAVVRGIVDLHTLDQAVAAHDRDRYVEGSRESVPIQHSSVSVTRDGRLVPKHPVAFSLVLVPFYAALREWGLLLFNVVQCVLLVLLCYRLARLWFEPGASALAALAFLAEGIVRHYSYNVSPDVFGAVLVLGGVITLWTPPPSRRRFLAGGLLLGASLWMRPSNAVAAVALLPTLVDAVRHRPARRDLAWAAAAYAGAAGAYLALNAAWFGSPLVTSYDRVLVLSSGVRTVGSHRDHMGRPFLASLATTFLDGRHGFLQTAPHAPLLLVAALPLARRAGARTVAVAVLTFAPVLLLVRYEFWDASSYGNRFFLLPAAVSALAIAWFGEVVASGGARPGSADLPWLGRRTPVVPS